MSKINSPNKMTQAIIKTVCDFYSVEYNALRTQSRHRTLCEPRHVSMYLLEKYVKSLTFKHIAGLFNRVNHTTAHHAKKSVIDRYEVEPQFRKRIDQMESIINSQYK